MTRFQTSSVENRTVDFNPDIGTGIIQFIRLPSGITLTVMNCRLKRPITLTFTPPFEAVGFSYNLSGHLEAQPDNRKEMMSLKPGQSDMKWCPGLAGLTETIAPGTLTRVGLSMTHEVLYNVADRYMHPLPPLLQNPPDGLTRYKSVVTPQMRAVIFQMMKCPYQGLTRDLFIEGKVLELLAYQFEQLGGSGAQEKSVPLKPGDLERIHHAARLLTDHLEKPLSLEQLAGSVGMCRTRFYECFRKIHGETPLEYLRHHRLESAMNYLLEGRMNVTETAFAVGYSSSGYFSKAFKKHFGDLPKHYCRKHASDQITDNFT